MKYFIIYCDGEKSFSFSERAPIDRMLEASKDNKYFYPVAVVKVTPREELMEHEMEAQLRSVFNDIPGVSFSHQ